MTLSVASMKDFMTVEWSYSRLILSFDEEFTSLIKDALLPIKVGVHGLICLFCLFISSKSISSRYCSSWMICNALK